MAQPHCAKVAPLGLGGPRLYPSEDSCRWLFSGDCSAPSRGSWLRECVCLQLDRKELGPFRQQLEEQWQRSLEQLKEKAPPREADNAAGIKM